MNEYRVFFKLKGAAFKYDSESCRRVFANSNTEARNQLRNEVWFGDEHKITRVELVKRVG